MTLLRAQIVKYLSCNFTRPLQPFKLLIYGTDAAYIHLQDKQRTWLSLGHKPFELRFSYILEGGKCMTDPLASTSRILGEI